MILDVSPLGRHRDYRLLFAGQFVSAFGSMITYAAVPYQVFELTRSSLAVGMLGVVQLVPLVVFALWGGAYADAMDRRKLVIVSELLLTGASLALAVNSMLPRPGTWTLFAVTAVVSVVNGFHRPALQAITPKLVDREDLTAFSESYSKPLDHEGMRENELVSQMQDQMEFTLAELMRYLSEQG